MAQKENNLPHN